MRLGVCLMSSLGALGAAAAYRLLVKWLSSRHKGDAGEGQG